jgi:thioredoxin reductase (NADPH)
MIYDILIIGGGPAGLSAAIYSSRARLKTLLIEKEACGGHLIITDHIENYPGFNEGVNGFDLAMKLESQAKNFGAEIINDEIISVQDGKIKKVITENTIYEAKVLIIASGTKIRQLGISSEPKFVGKGVSYCAVCDAPFFKDKVVAVIGGGDSAIQEALYLSKFAKEVKIIHRRDSLRAAKLLQEKMSAQKNINIIYDAVPIEISGGDKVESLTISNVKTKAVSQIPLNGIFVFIGLIPNSDLFEFLSLDEHKYIITDENMKTSVSGIFACGDIRRKQLRQIVTAASDGAQAAISAEIFLTT